ncbi:MAG: DUF3817 domain-containing protein [Gammaproteobacteria bacterium]
MLKAFRIISILEGLSFLTLLALVVFGIREHIFVVGMGHGVLFMAYFIGSLLVSHKQGWSILFWLLVLLCAVIPFAFIPLEMKLNRMGMAEVTPSEEVGEDGSAPEHVPAVADALDEGEPVHGQKVREPAEVDRALVLAGGGGMGIAGLIVTLRFLEFI